MLIGIDASRAFVKNRTGIEEYSYQVIKNLMDKLNGHQVVLYIRSSTNYEFYEITNKKVIKESDKECFALPENWRIKTIKWPRFWTQIGLSLEIFFHPVDVLFIPAHTVPIIHPKNTVVVIHGLEYEFCLEAYSWWEKFYMRRVIKNSCRWAKTIISVSNNTKNDLVKLYSVPANKIRVIYEGVSTNYEFYETTKKITNYKLQITNLPYLLFIGRLEKRKNITGIIKAFEILKEKYNIPHKLILAGEKGYGYKNIQHTTYNIQHRKDIILTGFVSEEDKWKLLKNAEVFLFPTFYEGFGLPILEAQSVGTPVVAGDNSSIPEISTNYPLFAGHSEFYLPEMPFRWQAGEITNRKRVIKKKSSVMLIDPNKPQEIAEAVQRLILDKDLRNNIIKKGYKNVKRFSWEKCTDEIVGSLLAN